MDTYADFSGFFQLFYYCSMTYLPKDIQKSRKVEHFILAVTHLAIIISIFTFIYFYPDLVYFNISLTVQSLDVAQICGPIIGHLVIICEAAFQEKSDQKIFNTIRIIDESSNRFFVEPSNWRLIRRNFLRFIILASISPLPVFMIAASTIRIMPQWAIGWLVRYWSLQVGLFSISQYVLYIQFLTERMDSIRQELDNLGNIAKLEVKWNSNRIYDQLRLMKKVHSFGWYMASTVARRFRYSILAMMANTFIAFTTQGYWLFSRIYYRTSFYMWACEATTAKDIIMLLPILSGMITCNFKFINTYRNAGNLLLLRKTIQKLESRIEDYEEKAYIVRKVCTVSRLIIFFVTDATFIIVMGLIAVLVSNDRGTLVSAWFPFDWKECNARYYSVVIFQGCATLLQVWQDCLNESYPMIFLCAIIAHLHLINMRFARIGYDSTKTKQENHQDLLSCIQDYHLIVEIFAQLQDIIRVVYFVEILAIQTLLCTNAIYLTLTDNNILEQLHIICFLIAIIYILGISCYFGSQLQSESQHLTTAIYSCNWIEQTPGFKKDLLTTMIISQRQIQLSAGRIVQISLPTFLRVIKSTYSLVALLNHLKD
ncbi:unnamed protein product [Hermetia illucens]|uniref:Odorant receptor n=1 Tax=Hermetia illucens TaxID=343691 RepID=A0A7R8YV11_HERIL|nr:unnamed protein product [Hermetia illucens]